MAMVSKAMATKDRPKISNWSLEAGYTSEVKDASYPIRVFSAHKNSAVEFRLFSFDEDVEYVCYSLVPGFKLYLHTPGDVLKENDYAFQIPFSEQIKISIKPKVITTSDSLRKYSIDKRQCFFNSERQLHFFKFYSKENCELECLSNYTLQMCECVKFSMPREFLRF